MRTIMVLCLLVMYATPGDAYDKSVVRFKAISNEKINEDATRYTATVSYGTCWFADLKGAGLKGDDLIVTAAHTLKEGERLMFDWGARWLEAELIFLDEKRDIAVLKSKVKLKGTRPRKLLKNKELVFYGSGQGKQVTAHTALPEKVTLNEPVQHGHSGGPVIDKDNKVVGMVIAGAGMKDGKPGNGIFVHAAVIREAIKAYLQTPAFESKKKE